MLSQEVIDRFHSRTRPSPDGCILWVAGKGNGYGVLYVEKKYQLTHRLAWRIANGPIPRGLVICHRCDVKNCVNPDHLFLGTRADNNKDARDKGIANWARGEEHYRAKLNADDVLSIRRSGLTVSALARHYGVDRKTIRRARDAFHWKHVE